MDDLVHDADCVMGATFRDINAGVVKIASKPRRPYISSDTVVDVEGTLYNGHKIIFTAVVANLRKM
jgi:hypothetical protein